MRNPRVEYEMTKEELAELKESFKPVVAIMVGGSGPSSPQENANRAWASLGKKGGFDSMTVRPSNKGERFFTAVPNETTAQEEQRLKEEKETSRTAEIKKLNADKEAIENRLSEIEKEAK